MTDTCTNKVNFHYVCEFGSVTESVKRKARIGTGVHLAAISTAFNVPAVRCPDGHYTQEFLACDLQSSCWAKKDIVLQTSPDTLTVPTSSWCNTSMTSADVYFLCASGKESIPFTLVCDYMKNCFDGSDEDFCVYPPCSTDKPVPCGNSGQVCE